MNAKFASLVIGVGVVVTVGAVVYLQYSREIPKEPAQNVQAQAGTVYTKSDVGGHANASSCWTIIDSGVYDFTAWASQHPGGAQAILSFCGKDGTMAFRAQHGTAQREEDILASFRIGEIAP